MNIDKVKIQEAINSFLDEKVAQLRPLHKTIICVGAILLPCRCFLFFELFPKNS